MTERFDWSIPPWGVDPRPYVGKPLVTGSGEQVRIEQAMIGWSVWREGAPEPYRTGMLLHLAYWLNLHDVRPDPVHDRTPESGQASLF